MSLDARAAPAASLSSKDESLGPFLRALGRHWLLVLVIVGLAAGVAASTVLQRESTYEASTSVVVKPLPQGDPTFIGIGAVIDSVDPTRTVQTAASLMSTPTAARVAAQKMGPGWTRARVESSVRVTPRGESYVLAITAKAPTARDAARLANIYTNAALDARAKIVQANLATNVRTLRRRLIRLQKVSADAGQLGNLNNRFEQLRALQALGTDPSLQLSQRATAPTGAIGTSPILVVALAIIGGLILGAIAALALEFFTRRVRDEEEISQLYPIPILAGIPRVRGFRKRHIDPRSLPAPAFEQVRLLRVQLPLRGAPASLLITSATSGDGKTTTASALATAIALGDEDVILLDVDQRKPGTTSVFEIPRPLHVPVRGAELQLHTLLHDVPGLPRLRVMPAPMGDALALEQFTRQVPRLIAQAKELASCVIVDAAPVLEVSDALRVATACDHALFVVRPRHTDRARFILTRDLLTRSGITPVGIVVVGEQITGSHRGYYSYEHMTADFGPRTTAPPGESPLRAVSGAPPDG